MSLSLSSSSLSITTGKVAVGVGSGRELHGSDDLSSSSFSRLARTSGDVFAIVWGETVKMKSRFRIIRSCRKKNNSVS